MGALLGNFVGGKITDRYGFSALQFKSLFFNGILFIALGQLQTFWQIAVCLFVTGIVGESFRPANAAAIAYYSSAENRTRSYSLNRLAINLGFSIGPAISGILPYYLLFWVDGLTCIIAAVILRLALPPVQTQKQSGQKAKIKTQSVWKDQAYLCFMIFVFIAALCFLQMFSILPLCYKEELHFSKSLVGFVIAMNGLIIAVTEMVLMYKLENKRPAVQYISAGAFFIGLSYAIINILAQGLPLAITAMLIITLGEMLMFPFIHTYWISRSTTENRGQYASVYSMLFAAAYVIAPTFGSQIVRHTSYTALGYIVFMLCVFAMFGFSSSKK
ncbi:MAG: MFS transporter [Chitinophagaceae bacterium]